MSWVDIAIVVFVIIGAVRGYREGFLVELFSLIGIILGILAGFKLMGIALVFLSERFNIDEKLLPYIAFAVVFLAVVIIISLLARWLKSSIDKSFLGSIDQAAGSLLGGVKTVFMLSVLVWLATSFHLTVPGGDKKSQLLPYITGFAPATTDYIGELIPAFNDIF